MHSAVHKYSHSIRGTLNLFTIRDILAANNNHFAEETDIHFHVTCHTCIAVRNYRGHGDARSRPVGG